MDAMSGSRARKSSTRSIIEINTDFQRLAKPGYRRGGFHHQGWFYFRSVLVCAPNTAYQAYEAFGLR